MEVSWGFVTQVSPLEVRFAGDSGDSPVLKADHVTVSDGDRVALIKLGSSDGWLVIGEY